MNPILPGATLGVLGGGQLGRMFALSARKLGYRVHTYDPSPESPAGQVSDREINRSYEDAEALIDFASQIDVLTYEFENIPTEALDVLADRVPLRPNRDILHVTQHRRREKEFLQRHGFPVTNFRVVASKEELRRAVEEINGPCVLKTAEFGYDGKGQVKIGPDTDLSEAWTQLGGAVGVLEAWVEFERELSCLVARNGAGQMTTFPVVENQHTHHILDLSLAPARVAPEHQLGAERIARDLAEQFGLVGILAVEFFLTRTGKLLVNELAPRPHNSGHFTFDGCITSQFEQQLRAVCDLPLGETRQLTPAIMRNLLGDLWIAGEPAWVDLLALHGLKLHLYGKSSPRPGRKMGHYTVLAPSLEECLEIDRLAQAVLRRR